MRDTTGRGEATGDVTAVRTVHTDGRTRVPGMSRAEHAEAGDRGVVAAGQQAVREGPARTAEQQAPYPDGTAEERGRVRSRPLWVEEPARRFRLPDPVRTAAVRAVIIIAVTLIQAMIAILFTLAGAWPAFPLVLSSIASTVLATWAVLDVWVTRQVWSQRHGVVSQPSSTARALRRERRRARRQERAARRAQGGIRGQGGTGHLSHL